MRFNSFLANLSVRCFVRQDAPSDEHGRHNNQAFFYAFFFNNQAFEFFQASFCLKETCTETLSGTLEARGF